jgi:hypothetical protein
MVSLSLAERGVLMYTDISDTSEDVKRVAKRRRFYGW